MQCSSQAYIHHSRSVIPITIPQKDHLAELGLVETPATVISQKNFSLIPGIVVTNSQDLQAVIQNFSSNPITLYRNMKLGTCESYYQKFSAVTCCRVAEPPLRSTDTTSGLPEHLVDLMTRSTKHLYFEESLKLRKLLINFQSVFATSSDDLGRTDLVQHTINTGPANPIRQCPRLLPEVEKQELEKMLRLNVIELSSSAWSSLIVLVTKKDRSTRFCIDYRKLNDVTVKDAYPLPRIDECLDSLWVSKWFSSMDLNSGFWQIGMAEGNKHKQHFLQVRVFINLLLCHSD